MSAPQRPPRPTRPTRAAAWLGPLLPLLFTPAAANAAAFVPAAADPPTGAVRNGDGDEAAARSDGAEPLRGNGIQWRFGPWRTNGSLALDLRSLRQDGGLRSSSSLLLGDVDFASWIWQPWFIQVRFGLGWVASRSSTSDSGNASDSGRSLTLNLRAALALFPASRFPLELRADMSDSRSGDLTLGGDYRSQRLALTQSWRPEKGNQQLQLQFDHSRIDSHLLSDTLTSLAASAVHQEQSHQFEAGLTHSEHHRSDSDERTQLSSLRLRHGFNPSPALQIESLASWNSQRFGSAGAGFGSQTWQLSSFGSWRLPGDSWLGSRLGGHAAPLLAASARWVQVKGEGGTGGTAQAFNATLGLSHEVSAAWRFAMSALVNWQQTENAAAAQAVGLSGSASWAPPALAWGDWRYMPSLSASASMTDDSVQRARRLLGWQAGHSLARDLRLTPASSLTIGLTQSVAALHESGRDEVTRALAHGASLGWQHVADGGNQSYAALSLSQSRSGGAGSGSFTLANLQLSQRMPLSRYSSVNANATLQATRNRSSDIDPFSGQPRVVAEGWQPFYSASASYEQQRAFDVPRLRLVLLLAATSQPLERRALGDIDAPRERIGASAEARLDWSVGRLETRLSARAARVDGRLVSAFQARAQRRF